MKLFDEQAEAKVNAPSDDDLKCVVVQVSARKYALAVQGGMGDIPHYYQLVTKPMSAIAARQAREYYYTASRGELQAYLWDVGSDLLDL